MFCFGMADHCEMVGHKADTDQMENTLYRHLAQLFCSRTYFGIS